MKTHPILPRPVSSHLFPFYSGRSSASGKAFTRSSVNTRDLQALSTSCLLSPRGPPRQELSLGHQGGGWGFQEALEFILLVVSRDTGESETICN